jgi:hypothetical protein
MWKSHITEINDFIHSMLLVIANHSSDLIMVFHGVADRTMIHVKWALPL